MKIWPFSTKKEDPREFKKYTAMELLPYTPTVAKWNDYSLLSAVRAAYKRSVWVYACIDLRANNIASVPWFVEKETRDGWERDGNHDYNRLIKKPNGNFAWSAMMKYAVYLQDLSGDYYISKEKTTSGRVMSLWPLIPDSMKVKPGRFQLIESYVYQKGSVKKDIPAEDIIHLKYISPETLYFGLAPLHAAARCVDIDEEAESLQKKSLQTGGVPRSVFAFENIDQKSFDLYQQWLDEQESKGKKNWIIGNGKWQAMSQTAQELDFINSRKFTREEICAAFKVPPPLVGIYDNATLANIETAKKILWQEGLIPVLNSFREQINNQLFTEAEGSVRLNYDLSNVTALQESFKEKVESAKGLWAMAVPFSEINRRLELGVDTTNMPNADVGYLPAGILPADIDMSDFTPGSNAAANSAYGDGEKEEDGDGEE